jgi:hypothetical protein
MPVNVSSSVKRVAFYKSSLCEVAWAEFISG